MNRCFAKGSFVLDRQKLLMQLGQVGQELFGSVDQEQQTARLAWMSVQNDEELAALLQSKKWSLLVPGWQGVLSKSFPIHPQPHPYRVLAVDGSQIYYDKHQGPACHLINVGSVALSYGLTQSSVQFHSQPSVVIAQNGANSAEAVNLQREQAELCFALQQSQQILQQQESSPFLCMFDGTLIFFQADGQNEEKEQYFKNYVQQLDALYSDRILHAGYVSFPRSKELVNILKLSIAQFDEKYLDRAAMLHRLTDMDVAKFFLPSGYRSIVFVSKAPITYLYPKDLKPYFCYLNVGFEIARLEFPAWIAQNESFVDLICAIAFDQVQKGKGYPVCLFEAHEQAVIKSYDREFFYMMIQKMTRQHAGTYQISTKSMKKASVPV